MPSVHALMPQQRCRWHWKQGLARARAENRCFCLMRKSPLGPGSLLRLKHRENVRHAGTAHAGRDGDELMGERQIIAVQPVVADVQPGDQRLEL